MNKIASRICVAAAALAIAVAAHAGSGSGSDIDDGQKPPLPQDNVPPVIQNEAPVATPKECLTDKSGFRTRDGQNEFYVELINVCDKPLVCVVKAYVIGAEGGKAGSGTLQLAPARGGEEIHQTWTMATAQAGGMANISRSCKFE
ncbi:MAG: hypothetical protein ABW198_09190 [Pseudorhodoplanes sp.]